MNSSLTSKSVLQLLRSAGGNICSTGSFSAPAGGRRGLLPTIVFADTAAAASDLGWRKVEANGRITSADRKKGEMDLRQNAATQRRRSLALRRIHFQLPPPFFRAPKASPKLCNQIGRVSPLSPPPLPFRPTLSLYATCLWPGAAFPREIHAIPDASYGKGSSILRCRMFECLTESG